MSDADVDLLDAFDGHVVEDVRAALAAGADPSVPIRGKLATDWLLEQYDRSDRLPECLRLLMSKGAALRDPVNEQVVLNDAEAIREAARLNPGLLDHRTSLMSAFTSLEDATLLHVAAEFGNYEAARALIELGADVDARAGVDADGIGGQTPLFHTVSSRANRSSPIMRLLVESGADCQIFVKGVHWGKGHQWETTFFDVTPISYAQSGLMPQVHRLERDVYENVRYLLSSAGRAVPALANVPNRYLQK